MCHLQVLDFHGTKILSLPSSFFDLISIKALYLNSCLDLIKIPANVESLKHLEVLDIQGIKLNLLKIGSLIWLKFLRISVCNFDMGSHYEVDVSRFDTLEELNVNVGSSKEAWDKIVEIVVKEVCDAPNQNIVHLLPMWIQGIKLNLLKIGSLIWLKCLRISVCNFDMGNHYEAHVSRFDTLEELNVNVGSSKEAWDKIVEIVVKEVCDAPNQNIVHLLPMWRANSVK